MNIAVIGGGAFGSMTASRLAEMGETVSLFERLPNLMQGATFSANRLHLGFHYPRNDETARQCFRGYRTFGEKFESAILQGVRNAYFIAAEGLLTSSDEFLTICGLRATQAARASLRFLARKTLQVEAEIGKIKSEQ
jgi:glycine/D-amino acid oxidase-like deaminating enzyme